MKKLACMLAVVMALSLGLTACGGSETSGATADGTASGEGKQLVVQVGPDPETLDPALNATIDGGEMLIHSFETLLNLNENNEVIPGQAESWDVSEDGMTWTFHLRQGLKWSDGSDLTAEDFVYSWQRMADPATAAPYAETLLGMVKNFNEITTGAMDPSELGVLAPDAQTFVVELGQPCTYFDKIASFISGAPVKKDVVEANGDAWAVDVSTYVSNGPFYMTEWVPGSHIVYSKNPNYWDADSIKLDSIRFLLIEDENAAYSAYETGEAHMVKSVPTEEIPSLKDSADFHVDTIMGTYYLSVQTQKEPLNDPNVRKALSLAIDRDYVANTVMQGTYTPAGSLVGPGITDADGSTPFEDVANGGESYISIDPADFEANLAEAKQLLADAGYPNGEGFPVIEYLTNDAGYHQAVAEYLQSAWAELGITLEVKVAEWQSVTATRRAGDFDIARNGWSCDYNDPSSLLDLFYTGNGNNDGQYSNAEFDAQMDIARNTNDVNERFTALHAAEDILMNDMAMIPLAYYNDYWLQSDAVVGSWHSPYGYWYFQYADIVE